MTTNSRRTLAIQPGDGIEVSLDGWTKERPPPADFVISRKRDGSAASKYGDDTWDFSAYHPLSRSARINMTTLGPVEADQGISRTITIDIRWLLFVLMALRHGPPLSLATIRSYLRLLRTMGRFALRHEQSIISLIENVALMRVFISEACGADLAATRSLLKTLHELGESAIGFKPVSLHAVSTLETLAAGLRGKRRQHPPIPTRIYTQIISRLSGAITSFHAVSARYVALVQACHASPTLGRSIVLQQRWNRAISSIAGPQEQFANLLARFRLTDYFNEWGLVQTVQGMGKGLSDVQLVCKLQIQLFTGMRSGEALSLTYSCLAERRTNGREHLEIQGQTTKLNNGTAKSAKWVTCGDGAHAVRCAQSIARIIYALNGVSVQELDSRGDEYPLFVSASYLGFAGVIPHSPTGTFACSHLDTFNMKELFTRIVPAITDEDLCELEQVDPHRAWRSEQQFEVSRLWPLTSHQFRRSLALYASRSGLVTLPSLRRQLQHITEAMSRYYATGSAYAVDLLTGHAGHFGVEWQKTQPESEALAYFKNVLLSDDRLFGGHGTWVELHGQLTGAALLEEREKTVKLFKKGELSFRETPLGGCTSVQACDKRPLRSVVSCLDCGKAVIKMPKLAMVISAQESLVRSLDPGTVEGRSESDDLGVMVATYTRLELQTRSKKRTEIDNGT